MEELTAAHHKLPLGTLVRVTHVQNGKSVLVRITDRGIHDRRVKLDLCKEAADELGMVSKGIARVRVEVLPDRNGASPPESFNAAPRYSPSSPAPNNDRPAAPGAQGSVFHLER